MVIEPTVLAFREYASQVINEYSEILREYDKYHVLNSRLDRLKTFNTNLGLIKEKLGTKIEMLLKEHTTGGNTLKLRSALESARAEYINEYMCIGFEKDNDT